MDFMWGQGAKGLWVGALLGGPAGVFIWLIRGTLLFPADAMLFGAIICAILGLLFGAIFCAILGFLMGDTFFAWLKEWWPIFIILPFFIMRFLH